MTTGKDPQNSDPDGDMDAADAAALEEKWAGEPDEGDGPAFDLDRTLDDADAGPES